MTEETSINTTMLSAEIVAKIASNVLMASPTLVSYEDRHARALAEFASWVGDRIKENKLTEAEVRNLLRDQETVEMVHILAVDIIKESTKSKAVIDVMKVVQTAINKATGLKIDIF